MTQFLESQLRGTALEFAGSKSRNPESILRERASTTRASFDIFLTHAKLDPELLLGILLLLEAAGLHVYVDWRDGMGVAQENLPSVSYENIFKKMARTSALFFAYRHDAVLPKSLPWELAHFKSSKHHVATIRFLKTVNRIGREPGFISLYPSVELSEEKLAVRRIGFGLVSYAHWISSHE